MERMTSAPVRRLGRVLAALVLAGGVGLAATACGGSDEPAASSSTAASPGGAAPTTGSVLDVEAFAAAIERPGTTVVDVRTAEEYAAGHLAGAVNVDVEGAGFAAAVDDLDPSGSYALYCHSGNRSAVAAQYLADHGFASVVELAGGITAWEAAGQPVVTD